MDENLRQLLERLDRRLAAGDRLSEAFARDLATVWRDADRALRDVLLAARVAGTSPGVDAARGAALLTRVRRILTAAGYDALVVGATQASTETLLSQALRGRTRLVPGPWVQPVRTTLAALREIATVDLLTQGDVTARAVWRALAQHLFTTRPTPDILRSLSRTLDANLAAVRTLFDTQVAVFGRQIEDTATAELGPAQPFLYLGPVDDVTRDWCLDRVGKVYTRAAIEAMDNGQLPNAMRTGGGYNCRHTFMAVESQALKALVGTGQRIEPMTAAVALARDRRASKRRRKAA
jgi:hypothetical protein